jgi:hypothetical protein
MSPCHVLYGLAFFLFVGESGQDYRESPYEVLAGIAVEDRDLWSLVTALQDAEVRIFGRRYSSEGRELKAKKGNAALARFKASTSNIPQPYEKSTFTLAGSKTGGYLVRNSHVTYGRSDEDRKVAQNRVIRDFRITVPDRHTAAEIITER